MLNIIFYVFELKTDCRIVHLVLLCGVEPFENHDFYTEVIFVIFELKFSFLTFQPKFCSCLLLP